MPIGMKLASLRAKKSWGFGWSFVRHDGMFHKRSQHHHFVQFCKIHEVDGFLKTSVFDRNLGFSVMTFFFVGFGSSWYGLSASLHFTSLPDSGFSIVFLDAGAGIKRWLKLKVPSWLRFTHNINV